MPPQRPLPPLRDLPPPPGLPPGDVPAHDAARTQQFQALLRAEADAHEPQSEALRRAEAMVVESRRYIRRLLGGLPWVQGVWPGVVLSIDSRPRRQCTVRLRESGAVVTRVQYDPTPPQIGGQYAVRRTVRLNLAAERGAPEEVLWSLKVGADWLYYSTGTAVYRIPWPPAAVGEEAAVPELVVTRTHIEFIGVGGDQRIYLWTLNTLESWTAATPTAPGGAMVTSTPLPDIPTEGIAGAPGVVQLRPVAVDMTADPPRVVGYVRTHDFTAGSPDTSETRQRVYSTADRGLAWSAATDVLAISTIGAPTLLGTVGYTERLGWEAAGVWTLTPEEAGGAGMGAAAGWVAGVSFPDYGGATYALDDPRFLDWSFARSGALVRAPGSPLPFVPPQGFLTEVGAVGPAGNRVRALVFAMDPTEVDGFDDGPPPAELYRTEHAAGGAWTAVSLPSGTTSWYPFKRNLVAQDRTAEKLVLVEDTLEIVQIGTWFSEDGGATWTQMNTSATGHFTRGVIVGGG